MKYYIELTDDLIVNRISGTLELDGFIELTESEYIQGERYRRFTLSTRTFSDPINIIPEKSHEDLTTEIHQTNTQIQDDTLLGIELNTDTNSKVTTTGDDSLLLMELLMSIDEKLTQLLQPK